MNEKKGFIEKSGTNLGGGDGILCGADGFFRDGNIHAFLRVLLIARARIRARLSIFPISRLTAPSS